MPYGTGSLYVNSSEKMLKRENRSKNVTETEEAVVIQYLALGGHEKFTGLKNESPERVISSIHAGPGQQVFGYSDKQRCDLLMLFDKTPERGHRELHYHNYHGFFWHYQGHFDGCVSTLDRYTKLKIDDQTRLLDSFREEYAEAMSKVRPDQVTFHYHKSYSCDWVHGKPLKSLNPNSDKTYFNIHELLSAERSQEFYQPPPTHQEFLNKETLVRDIVNDKITGFITVRGGRENRSKQDASSHFGFCVQNFAPRSEQISSFTRQQMSEFNGFANVQQAEELIDKQPARTLNSTTFHQEETISTNYLKWLIKERNFVDFEITHFLWYKFGNHTRDFIEPLLQLRHEMKKMGNLAAAEILKLLVNGHYG